MPVAGAVRMLGGFSPGSWLTSCGCGSGEVSPHLDKPEGHLAQGRSVLPWKELFLSTVTCLPPPKPCWGGNSFLQPRQSHPQEPSLGLLGEDFACAQLWCAVCSHSLHRGRQGLEHCTPSFPSPFLCQGSQLVGAQTPLGVKLCWVLGPWGWARCLCTWISGRAAPGLALR